MQFSQPTGFEQYGQPFAFNTPYQYSGYPDIIGEGNVTSVLLPDGATQFLFLPTTQWRPHHRNMTANINNPYWNNLGAWFIRSVDNPFQPTMFNTPYPLPCGLNYQRGSNSDCSLNFPAPGFQLKFHNDTCTSTSDMHYFCPKQYDWFHKPVQQVCAAVQVDVPIPPTVTHNVSHYEVMCSKPCHCTSKEPNTRNKKEASEKVICMCSKQSNSDVSEMSCDDDCSAKKRGKKKSSKKTRKKSQRNECACKETSASDKYVTTYADQASGRAEARRGRETQTTYKSIPIYRIESRDSNYRKNIETEVWKPKTLQRKRMMTSKSSDTTFSGICESGCCSGSGYSETTLNIEL